MKQSDLNHLRRLVAWVRCEIGQEPEDVVTTYREIAEQLNHPPITDAARQRMVADYERAHHAPKYVRAAVKALSKVVKDASNRPIVESETRRSTEKLQVEHKAAGGNEG